MIYKPKYPLLDEADGETGAGGDDTPPGDPPPGPGSDTPPPSGFAAAAAAARAAAGTPPGDPPPGDPPPADDGRPEGIEDKFWDAEKKEVRIPDLVKSYREAQARMKGGLAMPPKDVDGYEYQPVEGDDLEIDPEKEKPFREWALGLGLNNHQYSEFIREHYRGLTDARGGFWMENEAQCLEAMTREHGSREAALRVQGEAFKVLDKFMTDEERALIDSIPSNSVIMNVLARIAPELKHDSAPPGRTGMDAFTVMTSEAIALRRDKGGPFWNPNKPGHAEAVAKVQAWDAECTKRGLKSDQLLRESRGAA